MVKIWEKQTRSILEIFEKITKGLNPEQKRAVETLDGPLLILAGAGSGKTRVLTHRMANLIASGAALPEEILCVTFTNKAAREMEHRIYKILSDLGIGIFSQLWISTFHSFCVRLLRAHCQKIGYERNFGIYDSNDQLSQIKRVLESLKIDDKIHPPKGFQSRISRAKMMGLAPEDLLNTSGPRLMDQKSIEVYSTYEREMRRSNNFDFDDLLLKTHELFKRNPDILKSYQEKFRYIMVDEYQDTNHIQYLLIQMLARGHRNLCVVGDEDQSIYSWRGADIRNILDFEKDFKESAVVKLEENYRSKANIIQAATAVISNNSERKEKTLFTNNPAGELIVLREELTEFDEARNIGLTIQRMISEGEDSYNDYAIFYRTNAQSRVLEEQLRSLSIPYRIVGGMRFYERLEIKDMLCYMKIAINPNDDLACKRIINTPARGIGKTTVEKVEEICQSKQIPFLHALQFAIDSKILNSGTTSKLRQFLQLIEEITQLAKDAISLPEFYRQLLQQTGYLQSLQKEDSPEAHSRIQNLEEFDNAIEQFCKERPDASLPSFLEEMALVSDVDSLDEQQNSVTLMTLHISKGLEFNNVFIAGLEEGLFPSFRSDADSEKEMEEERRLAYVGMTRARERLFLSHAKTRRLWGQELHHPVSRFVNEIPAQLIDLRTSQRRTSFLHRHGSYSQNPSPQFRPSPSLSENRPKTRWHDQNDIEVQTFPEDSNDFSKGMRVRHPTYGVGSIFEVEGSGEDAKVSVLFGDRTLKKFVIKFARLERV